MGCILCKVINMLIKYWNTDVWEVFVGGRAALFDSFALSTPACPHTCSLADYSVWPDAEKHVCLFQNVIFLFGKCSSRSAVELVLAFVMTSLCSRLQQSSKYKNFFLLHVANLKLQEWKYIMIMSLDLMSEHTWEFFHFNEFSQHFLFWLTIYTVLLYQMSTALLKSSNLCWFSVLWNSIFNVEKKVHWFWEGVMKAHAPVAYVEIYTWTDHLVLMQKHFIPSYIKSNTVKRSRLHKCMNFDDKMYTNKIQQEIKMV